eukprot:282153-Rhodomonas_salina.2
MPLSEPYEAHRMLRTRLSSPEEEARDCEEESVRPAAAPGGCVSCGGSSVMLERNSMLEEYCFGESSTPLREGEIRGVDVLESASKLGV